MEDENSAPWKKRWRIALVIGAVVFFLLAWLLPLNAKSFFVLAIGGFVQAFTTAIFLIRRLQKPTDVDLFFVKFGLIIYIAITFTSFLILDHAIPE